MRSEGTVVGSVCLCVCIVRWLFTATNTMVESSVVETSILVTSVLTLTAKKLANSWWDS